MTVSYGKAYGAFQTLEKWSTQNQSSHEEVRRLAAAANRYALELYDYGEKLREARQNETDTKTEVERLEAVVYMVEYTRLKNPTDGSKGLSDTAAVEVAKRLVYHNDEYIKARLNESLAGATKRKLEAQFRALEKLCDEAKFSARAAAGAVSKEYLDVK